MDDDFNMELSRSKPVKGRRAGKNKDKVEKQISDLDLHEARGNPSKAPQVPRNRQMGWGTDVAAPQKEEVDSRLIQNDDEEETVLEIIPDLEDLQEEDMIQEVANPIQNFNKDIATYRELDVDLMNRAAFRTIDDVIDMKSLVNNLTPHLEEEEDHVWEWDKLFADVCGNLKSN